jgi:hypothetical protein
MLCGLDLVVMEYFSCHVASFLSHLRHCVVSIGRILGILAILSVTLLGNNLLSA